jgi:hypothetical protein
MEGVVDIEDDYISKGGAYETITERAFVSKYFIDPDSNGHFRLLVHSNKICLITLAPSHPIVKENLNITSINFQANDFCNRLNNKVSGKKKAGAQFLTTCSILCHIQCENQLQPFIVRSNLVAKLIEINEDISKNPNLLKDPEKGYIAVVYPKLNEYERELGRWLTEGEYEAVIQSKNENIS